jgi:uncharacterized membrane protein
MANYLKQLTADLPRWVAAGYITSTASQQMLADVQARQGQGWFRLPTVLAALGGLLVFVGIISWVASNWNDIPRLTRVALLLAAMGGSFLAAHTARAKAADGIGAAFAFLGALIFGANLMLIAQIYNLPPNPPGGALLWALGAALAAILWPSQLVMALAFVLTAVWTWFATTSNMGGMWGILFSVFSTKALHFPFLLLWGVLTAISIKRDYKGVMHLAGITLVFWLAFNVFSVFGEAAMRYGGIIALVLMLSLYGAGRLLNIAQEGTGTISRYVLAGFALWLLVVTIPEAFRDLIIRRSVQFNAEQAMSFALYNGVLLITLCVGLWGVMKDRLRTLGAVAVLGTVVPLLAVYPAFFISSSVNSYQDLSYMGSSAGAVGFVGTILLSALTLAAAIGAIIQGYKTNDRFLLNIGFVLFAFKLLILYFDTFWSLAGRSLFFIIGGLLTIALAIGFEKQRRKLLARMEAKHV